MTGHQKSPPNGVVISYQKQFKQETKMVKPQNDQVDVNNNSKADYMRVFLLIKVHSIPISLQF